MFYSHEILTSRQYGVATVWLVSTVGIRSTTGNRRISRKDVEQVNVPKACETILQPAAPIALRLQGSLLYGLSRVYSQQCHYVLTDAERVQAHMLAFYNTLGGNGNALDPKAGKARRNELILQDDPEFYLGEDFNLPLFDYDEDGNLIIPEISQASGRTSSQLSPLDRAGSSTSRSFHGVLNFSAASGQHSSLLNDPLVDDNMGLDGDFNVIKQLGEDEHDLNVLDDWGIHIDADGNVFEEPELPQLPKPQDEQQHNTVDSDQPVPFSDNFGDIPTGGTDPCFSSDPPVPAPNEEQEEHHPQEQQQAPEQEQVAMANQENTAGEEEREPVRRRRQRRVLAPDEQTYHSRNVLRAWNDNYLSNVAPDPFARHRATAAEARNNAFNLIFGRGIADVGFAADGRHIFSPMAGHFAGYALQAQLLGIIQFSQDSGDEAPRGRRRTASEALEQEENESPRRVRPRLGSEASGHEASGQAAQVVQPLREVDPAIEAGRDAGSALPDLPSDVPWNRPSSQIPSSSIKGGGGGAAVGHGSRAGSRQVSASPLIGRSRGLDAIERFSDHQHQPAFGSDGFGDAFLLHSQGNDHFSSDPAGPPEFPPAQEEGEGSVAAAAAVAINTSQAMTDALDREGRNFHHFIQAVAKDRGYPNENDADGGKRQWVDFDQLFEREDRTRSIVVQAFHHVLTLATKNIIKVEQEGQGGTVPFGTIRVGVEVAPDEADNDDEEGDIDMTH